MNAARASLVALILCWTFAFGQLAAFAQVPVPPLSGPVVDQTGTLSSDEIDSLAKKIRDFEARKGSQISVLIVPTTQPEEIEQYSIRVAEAWKIGRKKIDDGAILLVAKNDRKLRIEVGYGLEGALTDVTTRRIIDEIITPRFRNGDFAGGISAGSIASSASSTANRCRRRHSGRSEPIVRSRRNFSTRPTRSSSSRCCSSAI